MSSRDRDAQFGFMHLVLRMLSLILYHVIVKAPWSADCEKVTRDIENFKKEYGV